MIEHVAVPAQRPFALRNPGPPKIPQSLHTISARKTSMESGRWKVTHVYVRVLQSLLLQLTHDAQSSNAHQQAAFSKQAQQAAAAMCHLACSTSAAQASQFAR